MADEYPFEISPMFEGERVRKDDMFVELAGPKSVGFELVRVAQMDEIEDGKFTLIGPDIKDMEEGGRYPYAMIYRIAGEQVEADLEAIVERRNHDFQNYIQGYMHLNQRYDIWVRIHKDMLKRGLASLEQIADATMMLFKSELPFIEKIQITFITDPDKVAEMYEEALKVYEERDARARGLKDEEVDTFYGCTLCQSFAPTHMCVITPQRYSNCGAISWFDARAAARVDPKGPLFEIPKGECLDPVKGEYSGANEMIKKKTLGEIQRVWLYTAFGYPHTSCGCFEAAAFYIPEVNGFGIVHRGFRGQTVNGLTFVAIADSTAGGRQVDGFHGISIEYMRSPKFLQADAIGEWFGKPHGGWSRVVWVPSEVLERVKDFVPPELLDKIATEKDVSNVEELKQFLKERGHPVVETWKEIEEAAAPPAVEEAAPPAEAAPAAVPAAVGAPTITVGGAGIRLILKNAKIGPKEIRKIFF